MKTLIPCGVGGIAVYVAASMIMPQYFAAESTRAILAALAICLVAGFAALVPIAIVAPRWPEYLVQAGMGTLLIRMGLTVMGGYAYLRISKPPETVFMTAIVIWYLLLLAVETWVAVRMTNQNWKPTQSNQT